MGKIKLGKYISEFSQKNRDKKPFPVYSVTNSSGFCTEYFTKDVSSEDKSNYKLVPYGYFAYNPSRINVGSVDCQDREDTVIVSPLYTVFSVSNKLNVNYLRYFFKSNYGKYLIKSKVSGSVRFNLKFSTLCNFEINEIGLEEQEKAVNLFSSIEDSIKTEEHELTLLDELIKSRFNELFGDVESNTHGYQICKLSEISSYWNGLTYKPTDVVEDKTGTLVLRSSNIQNGELDFQDNVYVNCPIKDRHFVKENDILMCSRNGSAKLVGKVALIKGLNEPTSFGAFMMIIRSKYYQYLKSFFESAAFKHQLSTGTATINQITGNMLNEIKLPIPPMNVVDQFSSFVESVDKLKFNVQKRIEKYKELLNKKMDEYFN